MFVYASRKLNVLEQVKTVTERLNNYSITQRIEHLLCQVTISHFFFPNVSDDTSSHSPHRNITFPHPLLPVLALTIKQEHSSSTSPLSKKWQTFLLSSPKPSNSLPPQSKPWQPTTMIKAASASSILPTTIAFSRGPPAKATASTKCVGRRENFTKLLRIVSNLSSIKRKHYFEKSFYTFDCFLNT